MKKNLLALLLMVMVAFTASAQWWAASASTQANWNRDSAIERIFKSVPVPQINTALERKMVAWRASLFDNENKLGYVYVICAGVGPIGYYTVSGKVSSLNSFLVPEVAYSGEGSYDKPMPDLDGTYGSNIEGVFFRTTDGTYVEMPTVGAMSYLYSDKPLPLKVPAFNVVSVTK